LERYCGGPTYDAVAEFERRDGANLLISSVGVSALKFGPEIVEERRKYTE